ncbi:MAG: transcription termination factor Rho [Phycisphaerales bacterium]|nr:transcription termination factor Rho [Phycisphaerales bacterium]
MQAGEPGPQQAAGGEQPQGGQGGPGGQTNGQPQQQPQQQRQHQPPRQPQKHYAVQITGFDPNTAPRLKPFEDLTSIDPKPRLTLEYRGCPDDCRLIDLFCPIGRGQRALIVSPPKAGKTTLLKNISTAIVQNHADVTVLALLIDERPEEVTDFRRSFAAFGNHADGTPRAQVLASSNDHNVQQHTALAIGTMEISKRMVEAGKHVVIVLDSITRLARAFNNNRKYANSGRTMSGGIDAKALEVPRQIFGSARNTEEAGSLTIIATCLVDTGSQMDQVIFEEFKGSGNMELILDRKIAERRIFPAIGLAASGTRKEDLLLSTQELKTMTALRRRLISMPPHMQAEQLVAALKRFPDNATLVGAAG